MKNKIKIYFFSSYSGYGGADLSISRLINGINKNHFDIDFISLNNQKISKKLIKKLDIRKFHQQELYLLLIK